MTCQSASCTAAGTGELVDALVRRRGEGEIISQRRSGYSRLVCHVRVQGVLGVVEKGVEQGGELVESLGRGDLYLLRGASSTGWVLVRVRCLVLFGCGDVMMRGWFPFWIGGFDLHHGDVWSRV